LIKIKVGPYALKQKKTIASPPPPPPPSPKKYMEDLDIDYHLVQFILKQFQKNI